MCSYQAWNAWVKKHRGQFKKYDKNKKRMGEYFEAYKWINTYKEKKVATAWLKQWGPTIHTRIVELNDSNLLRGGLPARKPIIQKEQIVETNLSSITGHR